MDKQHTTPGSGAQSTAETNARVAKNTIVLVTLRVLMPALAVSLVLLLSRVLGVEGMGRYTLAFSFLYMFNAIAPLGLSAIITRDGARDREGLEHLLANATSLAILSSLLMTICMAGLTFLFNYDGETRTANFPALNPEPEDMGQTLGAWGIDNGFYLVLPIYGPSTLRDAIGIVGDWLFYPASYLRPWYIPISYRAVELTNRLSFHIGDYEAVKDSALDPYLMFRSAYIQTRQKMVER